MIAQWMILSFLAGQTPVSEIAGVLAPEEICFKNSFTKWFFSAAQTIPIVRGDGIHQKGMDHAIELLNQNKWVNIFPEGKVDDSKILPFRWGIARLILESQRFDTALIRRPPIVIPIYHKGMGGKPFAKLLDILPLKTWRSGPHVGKKLSIWFGSPIDFQDPTLRDRLIVNKGLDEFSSRILITDFWKNRYYL